MMGSPSIIQIVFGSDNLPFCKYFYTTVFGFADTGERFIYSEHNGRAMGLGRWGGAGVLYMVGRQELMQLEFWTHTTPRQRPLPADWRPNDIGFCRLRISVPDFDATLKRLADFHVTTFTAPIAVNGLRRVCFRDPTETGALYQRVKAAGLHWTVDEPASFIGGNHVIGAVAHRMNTLSVPCEVERQFGYSPEPDKWWRPPFRT